MEGIVDLHTHTTASDGSLSPEELIYEALRENVCAIAVTDHDTVDGIGEAYEKGLEKGVEVIPGVEISTGDRTEIHVLGYFTYDRYMEIDRALCFMREKREERNPRIIDRLRHMGLYITMNDVRDEAGGHVIGRLHIARALCKKGYCGEVSEAFEKYLADGRPAFVRRTKPSVEEGIERIMEAGGIPVLAHPKYIKKTHEEMDRFLEHLKARGLKGLEVFYPDNTNEETSLFRELALKKGLMMTGGSDFHGGNRPGIRVGKGRGNLFINYDILENLKKALTFQASQT